MTILALLNLYPSAPTFKLTFTSHQLALYQTTQLTAKMHDIKTRFLILSDTHGEKGLVAPKLPVHVAIHCGDLTNKSKLDEFRTTLGLLEQINAPLKLVIAGNHDFTLDIPMFAQKRAEAERIYSIEPELWKRGYGDFGEVRQLFEDAKKDGIMFLDEGVHHFNLDNGASLTVYASPFTPSLGADWGFQYIRGDEYRQGEVHDFKIDSNPKVDVVITHGPPEGVLDRTTSKKRGGCEQLFVAVARARPRLHCFGHIHEGWGAKLVAWRDTPTSETPSHLTAIDNDASVVVDRLSALCPGECDTADDRMEKEALLRSLRALGYRATDHCAGSAHPIMPGRTTLFANTAIKSTKEGEPPQLPWVIDIDLPAATPSNCV